jgi:hypothetical protein
MLLEVERQFHSEEMLAEVRWRLEALNVLAQQRELEQEFEVLRDELTRIFTLGGGEAEVLERLRALTHIEGAEGRLLELRLFLTGERRIYDEGQYREVLARKIENTRTHVWNLSTCYPETARELGKFNTILEGLAEKLAAQDIRTLAVKRMEDRFRETPIFGFYEDLKLRFLREWLKRFARMSEAETMGLSEAEVHRLIQEYRRHQVGELLKARIRLRDDDLAEHLGIHDTLEGGFHDERFWAGANVKVKRGFNQWVLTLVQAFGMTEGRRYVFFQAESDESLHLLAGLGFPALPTVGEEPIRMVPYLKPFTRKSGYLLEIRQRNIGGIEEYHRSLMHYALPFLFALEQVEPLQPPAALRTFFMGRY